MGTKNDLWKECYQFLADNQFKSRNNLDWHKVRSNEWKELLEQRKKRKKKKEKGTNLLSDLNINILQLFIQSFDSCHSIRDLR